MSQSPMSRGRRRAGTVLMQIFALVTFGAALVGTAAAATVFEPANGSEIHITPSGEPNPPTLLHLERVFITDTEEAVMYEVAFDGPVPHMETVTEFVAGEDIVATILLPEQVVPGPYQVRCRPIGPDGLPVEGWSLPVDVFVVDMVAVPFTPAVSQSVGGVIVASFVDIPPSVVLDAAADFKLLAVGPVSVLGQISGAAGAAPGSDGVSVQLLAAADVTVNGSLVAGSGASGQDVTMNGGAAGAGPGGAGGRLVLAAHMAPLHVLPDAVLASGGGGAGGAAASYGLDAVVPGDLGGDAEATGGGGGAGGALIVFGMGGDVVHPHVPGIFTCGDGGAGGSATGTGGLGGDASSDTDPEGPGGGAWVEGGAGGDSGDLYLSVHNLDSNGDLLIEASELALVAGGAGGPAGGSIGVAGENGLPWISKAAPAGGCYVPNGTQPATVRDRGSKGGNGWVNPGRGGDASARGINGPPGAKGGNAEAYGGKGGDIKKIGLSIGWFSIGYAMQTYGGNGGNAEARAGHGGAPSGHGGDATAVGGEGGSGPLVGLANGGGHGGWAVAVGGNGKRAPDCCSPPQANTYNGGNGGAANATGGDGGDGMARGGDGNDAIARAGKCGNGGDGNGPSGGGAPGAANATGGTHGTSTIINGNDGTGKKYPASACKAGALCKPECSDGVQKKVSTDPVDGIDGCSTPTGSARCAVTCPAGDLGVVSPIFLSEISLPVADLPSDGYGIDATGSWFDGDGPTDPTGRGFISYAATDVANLDGCNDSWIIACGTWVFGPFMMKSVDLDANGIVDGADMQALSEHLNSEETCFDLNGDGFVDLADMALIESHLGHEHAPSNVPVPGAVRLELDAAPNPFNPRTTLRFHLPSAGPVVLKVMDIRGRLIDVVVDETRGRGWHEEGWTAADREGRSLAAGVYFAVLETPFERRIAKLAVIK